MLGRLMHQNTNLSYQAINQLYSVENLPLSNEQVISRTPGPQCDNYVSIYDQRGLWPVALTVLM